MEPSSWTAIAAIVGAICLMFSTSIAAFFSYKGATYGKEAVAKATELHVTMNSRMDELLKASKAESRAEGVAAGKAEEKSDAASTQIQSENGPSKVIIVNEEPVQVDVVQKNSEEKGETDVA